MNVIRNSILITFIITLSLVSAAFADSRGNATYGIYTETYEGIKYDTANPPDPEGAWMGVWVWPNDGSISIQISPDINQYEGSTCLKVVCPGNGGVFAIFGSTIGYTSVPTDMSAYAGGTIDFMIKTPINLNVEIGWEGGGVFMSLSSLGVTPDGSNWQNVSIPLSSFTGINYNTITKPAVFNTIWDTTSGTFWIDNVVWRKSTAGSLDVTLKNISGDSTATQVTWSDVNLGTTKWKAADQYIELKQTYYQSGWGVQIYTDNEAVDANPKYTGTGDPAGLIDTSSTSISLPMCWRIVDVTTNTYTINQGAPTLPNRLWSAELGNEYPCFFWMLDRNGGTFVDGTDCVTAWDNRGMQHAESTWGGGISPNYIYLGADFSGALTPKTYKTNRLIVELFYE